MACIEVQKGFHRFEDLYGVRALAVGQCSVAFGGDKFEARWRGRTSSHVSTDFQVENCLIV